MMKMSKWHKIISLWQDNIKIAAVSLKTNKLRTTITVLIIAFGIMSLVGILTAISAIETSLKQQFANMGTNTFKLTNRVSDFRHKRTKGESRLYEPIRYVEAKRFIERYPFPAYKSISFVASSVATVKYKSKKTNPNITVTGVNGDYMQVSGVSIAKGRFLSKPEIDNGRQVAVIGSNLAETLLGSADPVGKYIFIGDIRYKIVGVFAKKGSSMIDKTDNMVVIPLITAKTFFYHNGISYDIQIRPYDINLLGQAIETAIITMRKAKKLKPHEKNNFEIVKSDNLLRNLMDNIKMITLSTTLIGLITLLGAAVGLMNIMLVSVSERTREIGIRKAVGATPSVIKQQFLFESVFIGQIGGILGIVLGIAVGNMVSLVTKSPFVIPWAWVLLGLLLTFVVGILSGLTPATKAAKLDPIIALHYE